MARCLSTSPGSRWDIPTSTTIPTVYQLLAVVHGVSPVDLARVLNNDLAADFGRVPRVSATGQKQRPDDQPVAVAPTVCPAFVVCVADCEPGGA